MILDRTFPLYCDSTTDSSNAPFAASKLVLPAIAAAAAAAAAADSACHISTYSHIPPHIYMRAIAIDCQSTDRLLRDAPVSPSMDRRRFGWHRRTDNLPRHIIVDGQTRSSSCHKK